MSVQEFNSELFLSLCKQYDVKLDKVVKEPHIVHNGKEKPTSKLNKSEVKRIIIGK